VQTFATFSIYWQLLAILPNYSSEKGGEALGVVGTQSKPLITFLSQGNNTL
jgi:hypothetical protein